MRIKAETGEARFRRKGYPMSDIEQIYAAVHHVPCKGLCHEACGPILYSAAEARLLQDNAINLPEIVDHKKHGPLTRSHLSDEGRCNIYAQRPLICRLYGAVKKMKCPHGCMSVGGFMSDRRATELLDAMEAIK
jgi:Fe-S-cluster containining protein